MLGRGEIAYPEYDSPGWGRTEIQLDIRCTCCGIPRRRFPCALQRIRAKGSAVGSRRRCAFGISSALNGLISGGI